MSVQKKSDTINVMDSINAVRTEERDTINVMDSINAVRTEEK